MRRVRPHLPLVALSFAAAIATGCTTAPPPNAQLDGLWTVEGLPDVPAVDPDLAAAGEPLYQATCASCHGDDLAGAANWKTPDDGVYLPPPLNSDGHAWHHSDTLLAEIIRDGSGAPDSPMVGFSNQLTDDEITAIIEYLKTTWGPNESTFQWTVTWQERGRNE